MSAAEGAGNSITRSKANRLMRRLMRGDFDPDLIRMLKLDPTGEAAVRNVMNSPHGTPNH